MSEQLQAPTRPLTRLAGWGLQPSADCRLVLAETTAEAIARVNRLGTIARGLGRSYGDAALNSGGEVLGMSRLDRYLAFDAEKGVLTCEAGVSLARIIRDFAPRGFFPMITPGTKYVTVGGCIANDIHGKAHHVQGSFSACVDSMRVLLASGNVVTASRTANPDLFWGSFGGMGLLGVILEATVRLRRVETTYFRQKAFRLDSLEAMLDALEENDQTFPYSVAYVDPVATGARLGSGVLSVGDHATRADLPPALAANPLRTAGGPRIKVPFMLPSYALNGLTIRALNATLKRLMLRKPAVTHYDGFFYPLDMIDEWNRGYGRRGFTQYQFVVPFEDGRRRLREILDAIVSSGELPFLNVLKRLGPESEGMLSFPRPGYTFAIDFPLRSGTPALLRRLDAMVLDAGGRVYLGKDAFLDAPTFRAMYPRIDAWLAIKAKLDPDGVFRSDLGRRVGLVV